jgi:hypothetical protein
VNTKFPVPEYRIYGGFPSYRLKALLMNFLCTRGDNTFTINKYYIKNLELVQIIIWFSYMY